MNTGVTVHPLVSTPSYNTIHFHCNDHRYHYQIQQSQVAKAELLGELSTEAGPAEAKTGNQNQIGVELHLVCFVTGILKRYLLVRVD